MALVFVSYAHEDAAFVNKLVADLRAEHVPVWVDKDIPPGERWDRTVQAHLKKSSHLLLVLSPDSVDSDNVLDEISYAYSNQKTITPILHRPCDIPFRVARIQRIDFHTTPYAAALNRLLSALPRNTPQPTGSRASAYTRFWATLLEQANTQTDLHAKISPGSKNRIKATAGRPGLRYAYALHRRDASVSLEIATSDKRQNKRHFDALHGLRDQIEAAFGDPLVWERMDNNKLSRIRCILPGSLDDEAQWPLLQANLIDAMIRLDAALRPYLDALD